MEEGGEALAGDGKACVDRSDKDGGEDSVWWVSDVVRYSDEDSFTKNTVNKQGKGAFGQQIKWFVDTIVTTRGKTGT